MNWAEDARSAIEDELGRIAEELSRARWRLSCLARMEVAPDDPRIAEYARTIAVAEEEREIQQADLAAIPEYEAGGETPEVYRDVVERLRANSWKGVHHGRV